MVVVDGIRYKPHEAPRHKAVLAPEASPAPSDTAGITDAPVEVEVDAAPEPRRRPKAK